MSQPNTFTSTELCRGVSIEQYLEFEQTQDRTSIARMIRQRFTERYITPLHGASTKRHGFSLMAVSCLMIEALHSFQAGWEHSTGKSGRSFREFFKNNDEFKDFAPHAKAFYDHVRCGILHQAETTGGWKIRRNGSMLDIPKQTINADTFHKRLADCLDRYCSNLENEPWDSEMWQNCRVKLNAIVRNCNPSP